MYCKNCGSLLTSEDKFCKNCGTAIQVSESNNQNNNQFVGQADNSNGNMSSFQQPMNLSTENQLNNNIQTNPIHQEFSDIQNNNVNLNQVNNYQNQDQKSKGFMNLLPLILSICAVVFLFINAYIGILLGIATIVLSIKLVSTHSKKSRIIAIIAIILNILYIIGLAVLSGKNLNGDWNCTSINSIINGNYNNKMSFNDGEYTFTLNGTTITDKYKIKPSTYDKDVWESVKSSIKPYMEITDDKPETFILNTDNNGTITIIKINTTDLGEVLFVYSTDTYVCTNKSGNENTANVN